MRRRCWVAVFSVLKVWREGRKEGSRGKASESETLSIWAKGDARAVDRSIQMKNRMKNNRTNVLVDHISESRED